MSRKELKAIESELDIMDVNGCAMDASMDAVEGNTRKETSTAKETLKRCPQLQYWCSGVWHYSLDELDKGFRPYVKKMLAYPEYGVPKGEEEENGGDGVKRMHYQCFWDFGKPIRPREKFRKTFPNIKFIKCKGNEEQNENYCLKEGLEQRFIRIGTFKSDWKITLQDLRQEQRELVDWLSIPVCKKFNRIIKWCYCTTGGWGKTITYTYLADNRNVCFIGGKEADMLCALKTHIEKGDPPDMIICNLTYDKSKVSYNGLESCADGLMFSGKYESGSVRFPRCQVVVFANCPPDESRMGRDRFEVRCLDEVPLASDPPVAPTRATRDLHNTHP